MTPYIPPPSSLVGIGMGLYELSYDSLKGVSYTSTPYWVYFRLVLGLLQLHMHLFRLLPMRLFPRFADSAIPKSDPPTTHTDSTHDAGKLSKGKKTGFSPSFFYKALSLCNICLTLTLFGSCLQIRRLLDRETLPIDVEFVYLYGESVSALIWGTVLLARLAGILTNSTKEWFYLAWSSDVKKGRIPYGLKRDKA